MKPRPFEVAVTSTAFDFGEGFDFDLAADGQIAGGTRDFADELLRLAVGLGQQFDAGRRSLLGAFAVELGNLTPVTAIGQAARLVGKAELHRFVAVPLLGADQKYVARARFDHRHRDHLARFVVNLRHPDLAAEYSDRHRNVP